MDAIRSAIARARLRMIVQATLQWWGWALLAAATLGAALVLFERLVAVPVPGWVYLVLLAAAAVAGPVIAWLRRPDQAHVAAVLDHRLGLKDRLGTALFAQGLGDQPLARHVVADAERATAELRLAEAVPFGLGRVWAAAPAAGALALALALGLPQYDLLGLEARQQQRQAEHQAEQAEQEQLAEAQARVREMTQANGERPDELADPDDVLRQLASLTPDELGNPDVRREMRSQLEDVRDRLDEAIDSQEQQVRTLRNAMSQLETEERGPADPFADAMRRGDFAEAQQELDRLARQHEDGELSEADREQLEQQFQQMSEQLDDMAEQARQQQQRTREQMREQLADEGLSEDQIDQLEQQDFDRDAVEEALKDHHEQQGEDEQQAQERAEQQAERTEQQQAESERHGQTAAECEELGRCMGGMAEAAGEEGGSEFQQEAWQAQRQLEDMQDQQGELERLARAREQVGEAEDALDGTPGADQPRPDAPDTPDAPGQQLADAGDPGQGDQTGDPTGAQAGDDGAGDQPGEGGGVGGHEGGTGDAVSPDAEAERPWDYETQTEHAPRAGAGRVIASWMSEGEAETGEAQRGFDEAATEARDEADRAVAEDRVPRRYHGSIRRYFEQLPDTVEPEAPTEPAEPTEPSEAQQ